MKLIFKLTLSLSFILNALQNLNAQTPQDNWDSVYKVVNVNPPNHFTQCGNARIGSQIYLFGDTVNYSLYNPVSYVEVYNPATNTTTPIAYTRTSEDFGLNCSAVKSTTTAGLSYMFLGASLNSGNTSSAMTVYMLNSQTNAITSEQVSYVTPFYREGIKTMSFFSPLSNNDTLIIFDDSISNYSVLYKKKYNQPGILNTKIVLPVYNALSIVFNGTLYVAGKDPFSGNGTILTSIDGVNFTTTTYSSSIYNAPTAMDTLNGELYIANFDGDGSYSVYKTTNGSSYTFINSGGGKVTSMQNHMGKMWFSVCENSGRPSVYNVVPTATTINTSAFEIGTTYNSGYNFFLGKFNNDLYFPGTYNNYNQSTSFGTYIYKLLVPSANFTLSTSQLCYNTTYSISNLSLNADSVRWGLDGNYFYSNSQNFLNFSSINIGTHTLSLIAFGGTLSDTLEVPFSIYLPVVSITGTTTPVCQNTIYNYTANVTNGVGSLSYNWIFSSGLSVISATGNIGSYSVTAGGNYTVNLQVTDSQGCLGPTTPFTFTSTPAKNITGVASTTAGAVPGELVTLYRYEPILTKFDSITTQTTDAAGGYTFTNAPAYTYLLKCDPANTSTLQVTYSPSALNWKTASILTHGCNNNTTQNINVIELTNLGTGPGSLSGKIVEGIGYGNRTNQVTVPGNPIKGVVVKGGRNPGGEILTQARTNAAGQYTLPNMPYNNPNEEYFILVDIPGLDTNTTYRKVLSASNPNYGNLDFFVDSAKINPTGLVGIKEVTINNNKMLVYPNPTSGNINVDIKLNQASLVKIDVMDIFGRHVKNLVPETRFTENELKISSQLSGIKPGVYFLNVKIDDADRTTKIIITD